MNTFLVADWHCGETRFELMGRPFTSQQEMIDILIKNHNNMVTPDDIVLMVGDAVYQKTPEFLPVIAQFNGRKTLFRGNHDAVFTNEQLKPYFDEIIPEGKGREYTFCDIPCWVNHYPTQGVKDKFNICGHVHGVFRVQLNMLNVGVDVHHFRPVNASAIGFYYKAICDFFDDDAWIAYNEINMSYLGKRGKKGSYFK